ncbi:MAG: putative enzyme related to lactoylglutathione lyase [Yoonia sp.]|jgi:predicted enzyme related to lactoylglutathione lyase
MSASTPISYIEFAANDLTAIKAFYSEAFDWQFVDYGPDYIAFENAGIAGGFYYSPLHADANKGSALIVLYTDNLEDCLNKVVECGGIIKTNIFTFPGGRRFHFLDPCQNELSVWAN